MRLLCLLVSLVSIHSALSQQLIFDKIGRKEGLPDNNILCMTQDHYGHLWFAGSNGLSLYNGYTFRSWRHAPADSTSLPDNRVDFIAATKQHSLLLGFISLGIYWFDYQKELFYPLDSRFNPHKKWLSVHYAKSGIIYVGSTEGLEYYDEATKKLVKIPLNTGPDLFVSSVSEDENGCLWLMCSSGTIARYNPVTKETLLIKYSDCKKGLRNKGGRLCYDPGGYVWIGTEYEGLYIYNLKTGKITHFNKEDKTLQSNMVLCFMKDHKSGMWVGTDNGGLYHFNSPQDKLPDHYLFDVNNEESISSNTIYQIIQIEPDLLLIGTYAGGLNIINNYRHKFKTITDKGLPGKALSQRSVLAFNNARNGKIWIGTDGGGLNLYDPAKNTFDYFSKENKKLPHSSVARAVFTDSQSRIWVGSYAGGVAVFDSAMKLIKTFSLEDSVNNIKSDHVYSVTEDHKKQIWLGTTNNGIEKISSDLSKTEHYPFYQPGHSGLKSPHISQIVTGKDGKIWALSETLHYFDTVKNKFTEYTVPGYKFPANLFDMCVDSKGDLWVGGSDAIVFKVPFSKTEKPVFYPASSGWFGNIALSIQNDDNGNIWLATDAGISCIKAEKDNKTSYLNFDIHDGILPGQFNYTAKMKDDKGFIYFGGTVGFHRFHPDQIILNKHLPKVSISDIRIFNQPLSSLPRYDKNRAVFWNDSTIHIDYDDKMISIEFTALDFVLPEKNKFSYMLEGFDKGWNYSNSGVHIANYTNLDPGTYLFKVKAANNDGRWNNETSVLNLVILPPWWMTWWARTIAGATLLLLLLGFYWWRTASIRNRNLQLKNEVETQTKEIRKLYQDVTESIQAAQVIQNGILPQQELLEEYFSTIEVFYQPKDVVSGDFYWCARSGNRTMLAVVDCTGHGVAGAFMTFVAYETLNQIVREKTVAEAGEILTSLNQEIISSMNRYEAGRINAGMDVSLLILDRQAGTIQYAGANNPAYIVRNEELIVLKGDRQGIGGRQKSPNFLFKTTHFEIQKKDQIYLFTDGFADQIGGEDLNSKYLYPRFRDMLLTIRTEPIKKRMQLLKASFENWRNGAEQLDDILVIGFEI